jgi:hypothetical protein
MLADLPSAPNGYCPSGGGRGRPQGVVGSGTPRPAGGTVLPSAPEQGVQICLYGSEEARRLIAAGLADLALGHLGDLLFARYAGSPADKVTGHIDHAAAGDRVNPLAEHMIRGGHHGGLFPGLPDRRLCRGFAALDLAGQELPRKAAFSYPAPDQQHAAVPDDDGSRDRCLRRAPRISRTGAGTVLPGTSERGPT